MSLKVILLLLLAGIQSLWCDSGCALAESGPRCAVCVVYVLCVTNVPEVCWDIPYDVIKECCPFQPFYADQYLLACDIPLHTTWFEDHEGCGYLSCVWYRLGWLHRNGTVNYVAWRKWYEKWSEHKYNLKNSLKRAMDFCFKWPVRNIPYPNNPFRMNENLNCQIKRLNSCVRIVTQWHCRLKSSWRCQEYKWKIHTCLPYLFSPDPMPILYGHGK